MTTTKNPQTLITPTGELTFLAHKTARHNELKNRLEFSARIEVDGDTTGAQEFKKTLRAINGSMASEKKVKKEGNYFINASSKNAPKVLDKNGKVLSTEEIPDIESGTVRLILVPFEAKKKGMEGGVSLVGIQLIDIVEYSGGVEIDDDKLEAAIAQATQ